MGLMALVYLVFVAAGLVVVVVVGLVDEGAEVVGFVAVEGAVVGLVVVDVGAD